jgi:hypothetical protein
MRHTSAYDGIRQHTSASICKEHHNHRDAANVKVEKKHRADRLPAVIVVCAYVSIRQHTSAYVSIRQHTSAYVSTRQHTSVEKQHRADRLAAVVVVCQLLRQ